MWLLLVLAAVVALEIVGLRRFYATRTWAETCRCREPWRGEFIANFGHPPEATRCAPLTARRSDRKLRAPLAPWRDGHAERVGDVRSAPAV